MLISIQYGVEHASTMHVENRQLEKWLPFSHFFPELYGNINVATFDPDVSFSDKNLRRTLTV